MTAACCCCGEPAPIRGDGDPWEGRMDGYCHECATNRCDCYPNECPVKYPRAPSATQERKLRLQTIQGVKDLLRSSGSLHGPDHDAIYVESNGYHAWLSSATKEQPSTAPISNEEILRRIEAREAIG